VTTSPSSLTKLSAGWSSRSSTVSDGRHSRVPLAVTTIGRLMDRVSEHEIDQLVVAPFGIGKPELRIGRTLLPQQRTNGNSHRLDQRDQPRAIGRIFQILNDLRFFAASGSWRAYCARFRMRDYGRSLRSSLYLLHHGCSFATGAQQPVHHKKRGQRSTNLRHDETWKVARTNAGKGICQRAGDGYRRIRK
jgi:hypothetical protein